MSIVCVVCFCNTLIFHSERAFSCVYVDALYLFSRGHLLCVSDVLYACVCVYLFIIFELYVLCSDQEIALISVYQSWLCQCGVVLPCVPPAILL